MNAATEEMKSVGVPLWQRLVIVAVVAFMVSQCTMVVQKTMDTNSDIFALRLKLNRIEQKIDDLSRDVGTIRRGTP